MDVEHSLEELHIINCWLNRLQLLCVSVIPNKEGKYSD